MSEEIQSMNKKLTITETASQRTEQIVREIRENLQSMFPSAAGRHR